MPWELGTGNDLSRSIPMLVRSILTMATGVSFPGHGPGLIARPFQGRQPVAVRLPEKLAPPFSVLEGDLRNALLLLRYVE